MFQMHRYIHSHSSISIGKKPTPKLTGAAKRKSGFTSAKDYSGMFIMSLILIICLFYFLIFTALDRTPVNQGAGPSRELKGLQLGMVYSFFYQFSMFVCLCPLWVHQEKTLVGLIHPTGMGDLAPEVRRRLPTQFLGAVPTPRFKIWRPSSSRSSSSSSGFHSMETPPIRRACSNRIIPHVCRVDKFGNCFYIPVERLPSPIPPLFPHLNLDQSGPSSCVSFLIVHVHFVLCVIFYINFSTHFSHSL